MKERYFIVIIKHPLTSQRIKLAMIDQNTVPKSIISEKLKEKKFKLSIAE